MNRGQEEKRRHSSDYIPYSYYKNDVYRGGPYTVMHWHSELEINYIYEGKCDFLFTSRRITVKRGDIIIIPAQLLHAVYPHKRERAKYGTLVFNKSMLGTLDNDRCANEFVRPTLRSFDLIHITEEHCFYSELCTLTDTVMSCASGNTSRLDLLLKGELLRLFWLLESCGDITKASEEHPYRDSIRTAIDYISAHFCENIRIETLARTAHLSESYFMNCFKRTVGMSAMSYIIELRIKRACELLLDSSRTVTAVALDCGFQNLSNFNRQYKKLMGCTPEEYRKTTSEI